MAEQPAETSTPEPTGLRSLGGRKLQLPVESRRPGGAAGRVPVRIEGTVNGILLTWRATFNLTLP